MKIIVPNGGVMKRKLLLSALLISNYSAFAVANSPKERSDISSDNNTAAKVGAVVVGKSDPIDIPTAENKAHKRRDSTSSSSSTSPKQYQDWPGQSSPVYNLTTPKPVTSFDHHKGGGFDFPSCP